METASTVIRSALQEILVQEAETGLEPANFNTGMLYLNRMMNAFAAEGINLGYTEVASASDPITVSAGAIDGMVYNLAVRLAPQYMAQLNPLLIENAREGKRAMLSIAVDIGPTQYPDTLSRGSGNSDCGSWDNTFYPGSDAAVLTETGGFISVESETTIL